MPFEIVSYGLAGFAVLYTVGLNTLFFRHETKCDERWKAHHEEHKMATAAAQKTNLKVERIAAKLGVVIDDLEQ